MQGPLERQAGRLGCGASGGRLSAPGSSLFPEPWPPWVRHFLQGRPGQLCPPGTRIRIPALLRGRRLRPRPCGLCPRD